MYNSKSRKNKKRNENPDKYIVKIKEMYKNYGIDVSDMSDEEFIRIKEQYLSKLRGDLDQDLEASRKHFEALSKDII